MHERSGGRDSLGMRGQTEAFEAGHAKLFGEQTLAVVCAKDPVVQVRLGSFLRAASGAAGGVSSRETGRPKKAGLARQQNLPRTEQFQFVAELLFCIRPGKFRCAKLASGNIAIS